MPDFKLSPEEQAKYRFLIFGITLLLATPSEFSQNTAGGGTADIKKFLSAAGITEEDDQNVCVGFIHAWRKNHLVSQASDGLREALRHTFGANQDFAGYPQNGCPFYADCVDLMASMKALNSATPK